jgi:rsbT co-antagonist protein RsbR
MPSTRIPETISNQKAALLGEWVREQAAAGTMRSDLVSESQLRSDSSNFLDLLEEAVRSSGGLSASSKEYAPLRQMLTELSQIRNKLGFSPSETATFVLSFKQPLFTALRKAAGNDSQSLFDDIWSATQLLDRLALHTTESFQQAREDVIRRQQEDMIEISTPVVRLWDGVVAVPLIGTLDSNRTNLVMEALLTAIVETRSEIAIIDITGVPTVDTLVAQHLLKTVAATRLMGADCIISGIRPQIAQTMVHLQIDLSAVTTKATLAEALLVALRRTGYSVSKGAASKK